MSQRVAHRERIEAIRRRLFEAIGVVTVTRHSLASNLQGLSTDSVVDALAAVAKIIDEAAAELET